MARSVSKWARILVVGAVVALCGVVTVAPLARAQGVDAKTFLTSPGDLLKEFPNPIPSSPTDAMTARVKALALADPQTLLSLLSLLPNATKEQKQALGKGLSQAADAIVSTNPTYANDIRQAIVKTRDRELVLAATSDVATGAVGGGAGSGGAVGGQTNSTFSTPSGTGPAQPIPGSSVLTGPFTISSSVTGLGVPSTTTTFTSTSP